MDIQHPMKSQNGNIHAFLVAYINCTRALLHIQGATIITGKSRIIECRYAGTGQLCCLISYILRICLAKNPVSTNSLEIWVVLPLLQSTSSSAMCRDGIDRYLHRHRMMMPPYIVEEYAGFFYIILTASKVLTIWQQPTTSCCKLILI